MYCRYCGKKISPEAVSCPYCGKQIPPGEPETETGKLVSLARGGDQQAISALYEQSYNPVFYTVKSMIKDEDAVFDILQDSYIKAFSHLDRFEGGEKFIPWVKQIAANTARDWLKKKKPLLFSELSTGEDTDISPEELFEDDRTAGLPEQVIDAEETKRLIREIIDGLPEDQRAVIGMYYYEGMSVRQIAAAMGVTENAVKSRLLYGRRKIEKKVRELEKKGTKLYGLAPIPFLLLLFRSQKAYAAEAPDAGILQTVLRRSSRPTPPRAAGRTHAAPAAAAKTAGTVTLGRTALIAVAAAAVIGGGIFGISRAVRSSPGEQAAPPAGISTPYVSPDAAPSPAVFTEASPSPTPVHTPTPEPTVTPAVPLEDAFSQYRMILSQAPSYNYEAEAYEPETYRYALVRLEEDNTVPALLLSRQTGDHAFRILLFQYDTASGSTLQARTILDQDSWGVGAYRSYLYTMENGGLFRSINASGNGRYFYLERLTLAGDELSGENKWEGSIIDPIPYALTPQEITWYDHNDLDALGDTGTWMIRPEETPGGPDSSADAWTADEQAAGRIVLSGTINSYSYEEAVELQGMPDWNPPSGRTYRIIVLDEPSIVTAGSVDGPREGEARLILADDAGISPSYDGQNILFSVDPNTMFWPSDTRIPVGQPGTKDIHILPQRAVS